MINKSIFGGKIKRSELPYAELISSINFLLLLKALFFFWLIQQGTIGLGPDEAQYWTWSQKLDWGYYSKPPGIAWQIWFGTQLFGNTELGVRFPSLLLSILISLVTYFLAIASKTMPKTAFWAAVALTLTPLGLLSSFLAITDGGLVLFWTLAALIVAKSLSNEETPNYYLLGLIIASGAVFKWPIYLFWPILLLFWYRYAFLRSAHIVAGMALSLLGLLPSLIWNWNHHWATFLHTATTVAGGHGTSGGNPLAFFGMQVGLISPILFGLLIAACIYFFRQFRSLPPPILFCGSSSLLILLGFGLLSLFQKIQGNWCDFFYPTGVVFLSWYAIEQTKLGLRWLQAGIALSLLLCLVLLFAPLPYRLNPFRHNLGWNQLSEYLLEAGYKPQRDFLFADTYQTTSILSFYGPDQKRAYFLNLQGTRNNQFTFWPGMAEEQKGQTGYFVVIENNPQNAVHIMKLVEFYKEALKPYFLQVTYLGMAPLYKVDGETKKGAHIFIAITYNGNLPSSSKLY